MTHKRTNIKLDLYYTKYNLFCRNNIFHLSKVPRLHLVLIFENENSNGLTKIKSDLSMTYNKINFSVTQMVDQTLPMFQAQKILLIFFLLPHAVFISLHMSLTAKELLTNRHEIHFVSTQLGTLVIQHLLCNVSSFFSSSILKQFLKVVKVKCVCSLLISGS